MAWYDFIKNKDKNEPIDSLSDKAVPLNSPVSMGASDLLEPSEKFVSLHDASEIEPLTTVNEKKHSPDIYVMHLSDLKALAESGDCEGQYRLANIYWNRNTSNQERLEAIEWYIKAANNGNKSAHIFLQGALKISKKVLIDRYYQPESPSNNYYEAYKLLFTDGLTRGSVQYRLGICCIFLKKYEEAKKWFSMQSLTGPSAFIKDLRIRAECDESAALYSLGLLYIKGDGVPRSKENAALLFRRAAFQGHLESVYQLGLLWFLEKGYSGQLGVGLIRKASRLKLQSAAEFFKKMNTFYPLRDSAAGQRIIREMAQQGDKHAKIFLLKEKVDGHFPCGVEVEDYEKKAALWLSDEPEQISGFNRISLLEWGASNGDPDAQYKLGVAHYNSDDSQAAIIALKKAADQGHSRAQRTLADIYCDDVDIMSLDDAGHWFEMSGERDKDFEFHLGQSFKRSNQTEKAGYWFRKAQSHGSLSAEFELLRLKAESGDSPAQYSLALAYANGDGVAEDSAEAVKWCRRASEQGLASAQCLLGYYLDQAKGVPQDRAEGAKWFRRSAEQGNSTAQSNLGLCYRYGHGVEQNLNEALLWFKKASAQGNETAKKQLDEIQIELDKLAKEQRKKLGTVPRGFFEEGGAIYDWTKSLNVTGKSVRWKGAASSGSGPFGAVMFDQILSRHGILACYCGDSHADILIVGREGWSEVDLDLHISAREGKSLHIYSQEMAILALLTGHDPFDADDAVLLEFGHGHPALEFLMHHAFTWPIVTQSWSQDVVVDADAWRNKSPLTAMAYHVGVSSTLSLTDRREVLSRIYKGRLIFPPGFSPLEQKEWGPPSSCTRLERISTHIARQISLRLSRPEYNIAVQEWQEDLGWLKDQFYQKSFQFGWPS